MSEQGGITSAILLQHMQAMETRLTNRIDSMSTILRGEFNGQFYGIRQSIDRLERKTDLILVQINNLDERVDHIETVELPAVWKRLKTP